jgi:hypothetical protein
VFINDKKSFKLLLFCFSILCSIQSSANELKQRIVLLGDAGYSRLAPLEPSLQLAADIAKQSPDKTKVLFLGDNIYTKGFPTLNKNSTRFNTKQLKQISYLTAQLQVAKLSGSELYILPGNHDWKPKQVDDQANYINSYAKEHKLSAALVPFQQGKAPLPEVVHLSGISLLFIDSTWWLAGHGKNVAKVSDKIKTLLAQTADKHPENIILITSHHPLKSIGPHGNLGKIEECIKAEKCKHRKVGDIAHPVAQKAFKDLKMQLAGMDNVIYAAGHDHSLQVFEFDNEGKQQTALVSGAANHNKISVTGQADDNIFALSEVGFMVLDVYNDKSQLTVYTAEKERVVFNKTLFSLK